MVENYEEKKKKAIDSLAASHDQFRNFIHIRCRFHYLVFNKTN